MNKDETEPSDKDTGIRPRLQAAASEEAPGQKQRNSTHVRAYVEKHCLAVK